MLLNVGFAEAMKDFNFTCTIFHDIDLLPMNKTNLYNCPTRLPLHMSARVSTFAYKLPYPTIFGGVTALTGQHFEQVNGYSNLFWGWGGEDDDMYNRVQDHGLDIARLEEEGYYKMARHKAEVKNPDRRKMLNTGRQRWGISCSLRVISCIFDTNYLFPQKNISSLHQPTFPIYETQNCVSLIAHNYCATFQICLGWTEQPDICAFITGRSGKVHHSSCSSGKRVT